MDEISLLDQIKNKMGKAEEILNLLYKLASIHQQLLELHEARLDKFQQKIDKLG